MGAIESSLWTQGERAATKAIRRAIAKPLRELRALGLGSSAHAALLAIDRATKATKRKDTK